MIIPNELVTLLAAGSHVAVLAPRYDLGEMALREIAETLRQLGASDVIFNRAHRRVQVGSGAAFLVMEERHVRGMRFSGAWSHWHMNEIDSELRDRVEYALKPNGVWL